ncbi:uncharacterized protein [Blastocystis hominis]|uniref:GDP-mannose 4,6-dehydratase n=1 Tax=Blastocystis hominis TaxID=12968 RepID=D8LY16_BLAHO|nr:uncharacterized protein [Blastocystis hominis]CBK20471.2 unnamed protein product [Blastocystis hominis]|eukprot:XP_012894519.1 uncharacterized protein [Blastocystis hominis]
MSSAESTTEKRKVALITGITGQDGSYLAELLLSKGYEVHGIIRRSSSFNTGRINHLYKDPHNQGVRFFLHYGDLTDSSNLCGLMAKIQPDEIYNLGAQSHVKVSFDLSEYSAEVDGIGTLRLLNAIRTCGLEKKTRLYQASTSELYGKVQAIPQNEKTPFYPRSPYSVAKQFSYWIVVNYREAYGMFLSNGILFNHESPRRGPTFVTRKITRAVVRIKLGVQDCLYLGNLNAIRDWGHARDYVYGMWLILQQDHPDDFVLSTGEGHTVREFCEKAFKRVGIEVEWRGEKDTPNEIGVDKANPEHVIVRIDPKYFRPTEVDLLIGDCTKAKTVLGWKKEVSFDQLVEEMVDCDMKSAESDLRFYKLGGDRMNEENEELVVV